MKKEEILEASKKENERKDPYVLEVYSKAGHLGAVAMLLLAFLYLIYELHTTGKWNPAIYSTIAIYQCVAYGYRALKLEKARIQFLSASIIWGILTILLILDYCKVF